MLWSLGIRTLNRRILDLTLNPKPADTTQSLADFEPSSRGTGTGTVGQAFDPGSRKKSAPYQTRL